MAIGDDAVDGGMPVVLGTAAANTIDSAITQTRDYIANGTLYWGSSVKCPISRGGTGSTTASGARTALGLGTAATKADSYFVRDQASTNALGLSWVGVRMRMHVDGTTQGDIATTADISALSARITALGG